MPKEKLAVFIEAFKGLEESVLWKWDADIPGGNLIGFKNAPQKDSSKRSKIAPKNGPKSKMNVF